MMQQYMKELEQVSINLFRYVIDILTILVISIAAVIRPAYENEKVVSMSLILLPDNLEISTCGTIVGINCQTVYE